MSDFSNNQRVSQGLHILLTGLRPFVEKEMENAMGAGWRAHASVARGGDPNAPLDAYGTLKTMLDNWQGVFRLTLKPADRNYVSLALTARNAVSHAAEGIAPAEAITYLNAFQAVLKAVGAKASLPGIGALLEDQMKSVAGAASDPPAAAPAPPTQSALELGEVAGSKLPRWRDVAPPHTDVMSARFAEAEFAADLATVSSGQANETYQDPVQFFRVTYPTEGLKAVLGGAIERLSGSGGDPVVGLQTAFGGGKTHTMLALYHFASAPKAEELPCVGELMQRVGVREVNLGSPPIVFVGTHKGPNVPMLTEGGRSIHTLWGYLAYKLAGWDGFERVREADQARTNPGSEVLIELLKNGAPCLILLDEVVAYARQLDGTYFEAFLTFFQSLTEAAKAVPGALVIGSLPESDSEAGGTLGADALRRLEKIFGRIQSSWAPATGIETYEIIRRRLFQELGPEGEKARDQTVRAFLTYYKRHGADFPATVKDKAFEEALRAAYPVHPELFGLLQERWSTLDKFQRTRGVLKLMAQIVFRLWRDEHAAPMILPGHVPLADDKVRAGIIEPLDKAYDGVLAGEVAGDTARPAQLEARGGTMGQSRAATRAATATFLATAPFGATNPGYEIARIRLACAVPDEQPSLFGEALRRMQETAAFLYHDGDRYWFSTQPTLNQIADDRARGFSEAAVENELLAILRAEERHRGGTFPRVHAVPDDPFGIDDAHDAALVILPSDAPHAARSAEPSAADQKAISILERKGTGQRLYRNRLIFLAADEGAIEDVKKAVRRKQGWSSIVAEAERGALDLTQTQKRDAVARSQEADAAAERAVRTAWKHLLIPAEAMTEQDKARGFALETVTLANRGGEPLPKVAWSKCVADGHVVEKFGRPTLEMDLKKVWRDDQLHLAVTQLRDWFAQYTYLHRLRDPVTLASALSEVAGTMPAPFAVAQSYDEAESEYRGLSLDRAVPVTMESGVLLVRREVAEKQLALTSERPSSPRTEGPQTVHDGADATAPVEPAGPVQPTRFHATIELDPTRPGPLVSQIAQSILVELTRAPGATVKLRLDIEGVSPSGYPDDVVSVVHDNAATLRIANAEFERE